MTFKSECVVVFGGSGFIGSHLLSRLVSDGAKRVVSVDIAAPSAVIPGVEYLELDVRRPLEIASCEPDIVFNLAAIHRTPGHSDSEYYDTNVAGALNVLEFCETHGARTLVFLSSISVYGPSENTLTESSPLSPNSAYGKSKGMAERIQQSWTRRGKGRRLIIVRPAVVFGPGEGGNFDRLLRAIEKRRFVYPGTKTTIKACGYVGELIRCLDWALQQPEQDLLANFAYPERCTIQDIASAISLHAGLLTPNRMAPRWIVQVGQRIAGRSSSPTLKRVKKLTESTNVFPANLLEHGYVFDTNLDSGVASWLSLISGDKRASP
jgi:GlcNAc-P-P-Und epimerase